MKNTISLNRNSDFKRIYNRAQSAAAGFVVMYWRKNALGANRLGITVTKKIGKAVIRNRIRRLIKESYRLREERIKSGYDFVFVARSRSVGCSYTQIHKDMGYLLKKNGLIVSTDEKSQQKLGETKNA